MNKYNILDPLFKNFSKEDLEEIANSDYLTILSNNKMFWVVKDEIQDRRKCAIKTTHATAQFLIAQMKNWMPKENHLLFIQSLNERLIDSVLQENEEVKK